MPPPRRLFFLTIISSDLQNVALFNVCHEIILMFKVFHDFLLFLVYCYSLSVSISTPLSPKGCWISKPWCPGRADTLKTQTRQKTSFMDNLDGGIWMGEFCRHLSRRKQHFCSGHTPIFIRLLKLWKTAHEHHSVAWQVASWVIDSIRFTSKCTFSNLPTEVTERACSSGCRLHDEV